MSERPSCVRNLEEIDAVREGYPSESELLSEGRSLARAVGLARLGIHLEVLPPGSRTSWPHAEEKEEEFILVLEGEPELWLDGRLHLLRAGDCVGFVPGTGQAHTFINNGEVSVRLIVVGERLPNNRIYYPLHPRGPKGMPASRRWVPEPAPDLGPHDGLPTTLREGR
jgi:uncharacterized cupin superfamily protein